MLKSTDSGIIPDVILTYRFKQIIKLIEILT